MQNLKVSLDILVVLFSFQGTILVKFYCFVVFSDILNINITPSRCQLIYAITFLSHEVMTTKNNIPSFLLFSNYYSLVFIIG